MASAVQTIDEQKVGAFLGLVVNDFGSVLSSALVLIGEQLGLYEAMSDGEPVNSTELAEKTGVSERYLREWLVNQAAGGYLEFDVDSQRFSLPPEHALVLAGAEGPADVPGGFRLTTSIIKSEARIADAMRSGAGMSWGEHDCGLFEGTERFFRPVYRQHLVNDWIPALEDVEAKLRSGAKVADIGCGHGASTILMAEAYPASQVTGFDFHAPSIERARQAAGQAGVAGKAAFEVADAASFPGSDYDLITFCDCFHDLPNPEAAARHVHDALAPDGVALIVEPMGGRTIQDNLNPVGRIYSAASMLVCMPNALANGPTALGAIASDGDLERVARAGGLSHFRRVTETPFNRVFEARR